MLNDWNKDNMTKLTLQMGEVVMNWEANAPCNDIPLENLIEAFYSQLIGFGYTPSGLCEAFRDFANEHQPYCDPDWKSKHELDEDYIEKE